MKKILNEELSTQLRLISYDRSLTLYEQPIIFESTYDEDIKVAIDTVISLGFTKPNLARTTDFVGYNDCKSMNQVFSKAAIYGLKRLSDVQISRTNLNYVNCFTITTKVLGGTLGKGKYVMNSFSLGGGETDEEVKNNEWNNINGTIKTLIDVSNPEVVDKFDKSTVLVLRDFQDNWDKIRQDYLKAFQKNKHAFNSTLFPDGWWNFFSFWFGGDNFTNAMSKINTSQKFRCDGDKPKNITAGDSYQVLPTKDQLLNLTHNGLMCISILCYVFGAAPIAIALEILDSAIYLMIDKDPYLAGLAFAFAFVGAADIGFSFLTTGVKAFLLRSASIKILKYTDEEIKSLVWMKKNAKQILKLANKKFVLKTVRFLYEKCTTLEQKFKLSYMITKRLFGLTKFAIVGGGPLLAWDFIAYKLGICSTVNFKDLVKSDWKILKVLGYVMGPLQAFSKTCESTLASKKVNELCAEFESIKSLIIKCFEVSIKNNMTYDIDLKGSRLYEVIYIQYVLIHLGYNQRVESFEEKHKELINTNKVYSLPAAKDWDPKDKYYKDPLQKTEYGNNVQYKKNQYGQWFKYNNLYKSWEYLNNGFDRNNDVAKELSKRFESDDGSWVKGNPLSPVNVMKDQYQQSLDKSALKVLTKNLHYFKIGYYDYNTEEMVRRYQIDNKLNVDGICGKNTMASMLIKIKKSAEITNYENISFDPTEIKRAQQEFLDLIKDTNEKAKIKIDVEAEVNRIEKETLKRIENLNIDFNEIDTEGLFKEWKVMTDTTKNK